MLRVPYGKYASVAQGGPLVSIINTMRHLGQGAAFTTQYILLYEYFQIWLIFSCHQKIVLFLTFTKFSKIYFSSLSCVI